MNFAVLPDYTAMEAYKGDTLDNIFASMEVLSYFPAQVIVLKGTQTVCALGGHPADIKSRMIDPKQTRDFPSFCRAIRRAQAGHADLRRQLLDISREATEFLDGRVLSDAATLLPRMKAVVATTFTPAELRRLRSPRGGSSSTMLLKLLVCVLDVAASIIVAHPAKIRWPRTLNDFFSTFPFRYSLCFFVRLLDWAAAGGDTGKRPAKVRNDVVDAGLAAYATYFDGLMSDDQTALWVYDQAQTLLSTFLADPPAEAADEIMAQARRRATAAVAAVSDA
jgi:hypothetical protein